MDKLQRLLHEGKISKIEYKTYITFVGNDVAKEFLVYMLESIVMEEPQQPSMELFVWHDGRRSVWRDIKIIINKVNDVMEKYNDGSSNPTINSSDAWKQHFPTLPI